ncbi:galactose-3-O-sulfotransferase 2-like isoform X1 [Lates japonicus]|nr:galactose-3-O-sulfotransferase 2-like isoform X1 [Lates japonicus]
MEQEVALLRMRREDLARVCLRDGGKPVEAHRIRDKNIRPFQSGLVKILGYELQPGLDNTTRTACLRMIRPEIQYKDVLDAKQFPRALVVQGQPVQQNQGRMVAAGGYFIRQDSSRTGERLVGAEAGGRTVDEGERDWDGSHLMRSNQTLMRGQDKGRLR